MSRFETSLVEIEIQRICQTLYRDGIQTKSLFKYGLYFRLFIHLILKHELNKAFHISELLFFKI